MATGFLLPQEEGESMARETLASRINRVTGVTRMRSGGRAANARSIATAARRKSRGGAGG